MSRDGEDFDRDFDRDFDEHFAQRLLAADPTLFEGLDEDSVEDFEPLPPDVELREEILRQQLVHGVLRSKVFGDQFGEAERRAEGLGSPGLEALLADLPDRPVPHPGVWAVLKAPVLLLTVLVATMVLAQSFTKKGRTAVELAKRLAADLGAEDPQDFGGTMSITAEDTGHSWWFGELQFEGTRRYHVDHPSPDCPLARAGSDGSSHWVDPNGSEPAHTIEPGSAAHSSLGGFPLEVLAVGRHLHAAVGSATARWEPASDGDRDDWILRVDSLDDGITSLVARIDPETSGPESIEFDLTVGGRSFHVQVGEIHPVTVERTIYGLPADGR